MDYLKRAEELYPDTVAHRRALHQMPETGMDLPQTTAYVEDQLTRMGYAPQRLGGGLVVTVGKPGGKVILLRGDMDALPMEETSGLPFASTGHAAHTCGHDFHAAWLLTAAQLLKENEDHLQGQVKLMFQPGEETFQGAARMISAGVLDHPRPDAALSFHVSAGKLPLGLFCYNAGGTMMNSVDGFQITVHGKGAHGAYPQDSVDPLNIAVHLYLALEALIAREVAPTSASVMTVGVLQGGDAYNIIPSTATLQGSIRTDSADQRTLLVRRLEEVTQGVAATYGGTAEVTWIAQVPPLVCHRALTEEFVGYLRELPVPGQTEYPGIQASASDDFAAVLAQIPGAYFYLSAGFPDRDVPPQHNPGVVFNEEVLKFAPAYLAHCAARWLEKNR
jgi:amidohydrolase